MGQGLKYIMFNFHFKQNRISTRHSKTSWQCVRLLKVVNKLVSSSTLSSRQHLGRAKLTAVHVSGLCSAGSSRVASGALT